ncbi:hypothetical protein KQX54_016469 [Cotesia glomerata]|uniref:Ankyrin repeat protein n=1 Tax=Cotesia glomerata TaxID=32391 RepID=A0AAV7IE06_COTGL|nr:hypothetical protein KQX54_016469 [Cotesia glomerata]
MVTFLLDHGADVNLQFNNNFFKVFECKMHRSLWLDHNLTLLHYSILLKSQNLTDLLLDRGANVNLKTSLEKTTLMQAVEVNNFDLVKFLVERRNTNFNDCDIFGQSVLHFTMVNANRKVSMYNSKEEYAWRLEKEDIVFFLLSNEADVNSRFPADKDHSSVIHYMIKYGFSYGVYKLLEHRNFNFNDIDLKSVYSGQLVSQEITSDIANDFEYLSTLRIQFRLITEKIIKKAITFKCLCFRLNSETRSRASSREFKRELAKRCTLTLSNEMRVDMCVWKVRHVAPLSILGTLHGLMHLEVKSITSG